MHEEKRMKAVIRWARNNMVAIVLVLCFIPIYIYSQTNGNAIERWGSTSMAYLNSEYYRWLTCIFFHFNLSHIFFNSAALLAIGSMVSPFIGKLRTLFLFIFCGILAEITCSIVLSYGAASYGVGSSGGIFALIAVFVVCYLRFPQEFPLKWYQLDVLTVIVFFILANDNLGSFMTHSFGFIAGIVVSFIMVMTGLIRSATGTAEKATSVKQPGRME
jgi:rhomboid protease GluP